MKKRFGGGAGIEYKIHPKPPLKSVFIAIVLRDKPQIQFTRIPKLEF